MGCPAQDETGTIQTFRQQNPRSSLKEKEILKTISTQPESYPYCMSTILMNLENANNNLANVNQKTIEQLYYEGLNKRHTSGKKEEGEEPAQSKEKIENCATFINHVFENEENFSKIIPGWDKYLPVN